MIIDSEEYGIFFRLKIALHPCSFPNMFNAMIILALSLFVSIQLPVTTFADVSQRLNYQGRLTDSNGVPLADGSYNMVFEIYDAETGGSVVWDQAMSVTLEDGLFSCVLGSTSDPMSGVNCNQDLWIQVTVGATTYNPRQMLTGVAYALTVPERSLTAAHLAVNVVSSLDGVTNDGGNIDLIAGSGIAISPDDGANTITIAVSGASIDHGAISGLSDDDHPQYFELTQNESVSGVPAFNGGTTGVTAPFTVDSTYIVANLNADLLDGNHASAFMTAGTDNWVNTTGDTMTGALTMSGGNGDITFDNAGGNLTMAGGAITDSAGAVLLSDTVTVNNTLTMTGANGDITFDNAGGMLTLAGGSISDSAGNVSINDTVDITGGASVTGQITSTLANGTKPFVVTSSTMNDNLNADMVDGKHYADATSDFVNVTGDTMTGALTMSGANGDITFDNAGGNLTMAGGTITDSAGAVLLSDTVTVNNTLTMTGAAGDITFDNAGGMLTLAGGNISDSAGNVSINDTVDITGGASVTGQITSTLANGTKPFVLTSSTMNENLNADLLDGKHYADATSDFVNVTGDMMTGALAMSGANGDITFDNAGGNLTMAGGTITDSAGDIKLSDSATITGVLTSTVANGTAPMAITSSTKVANLNSDKLDGIEGQYLWKTIYEADVTLSTTETQVDLSSYPNSIYKIYFHGRYSSSSGCSNDNWIQMKFNGSVATRGNVAYFYDGSTWAYAWNSGQIVRNGWTDCGMYVSFDMTLNATNSSLWKLGTFSGNVYSSAHDITFFGSQNWNNTTSLTSIGFYMSKTGVVDGHLVVVAKLTSSTTQ